MGDTIQMSSGIGLPGILTIVFVVLKLVGTISWSWWWVLSPLWIPFAFGIIIGLLVIISVGIAIALG